MMLLVEFRKLEKPAVVVSADSRHFELVIQKIKCHVPFTDGYIRSRTTFIQNKHAFCS